RRGRDVELTAERDPDDSRVHLSFEANPHGATSLRHRRGWQALSGSSLAELAVPDPASALRPGLGALLAVELHRQVLLPVLGRPDGIPLPAQRWPGLHAQLPVA